MERLLLSRRKSTYSFGSVKGLPGRVGYDIKRTWGGDKKANDQGVEIFGQRRFLFITNSGCFQVDTGVSSIEVNEVVLSQNLPIRRGL